MAFTLPIAAPAVVASLAYLNAKTGFSSDFTLVKAGVLGGIAGQRAQKTNKLNLFCILEQYALSATHGQRSFIAVPPTISKDVTDIPDVRDLECVEYTYRQVYDVVLLYAAWLKHKHGVQKGDIIALNLTNKPEFVFLWLAIWSLGAKAAFINTGLREDALLHCIKTSSTRLLLLDPDLEECIPAVQSGLAETGVTTAVVTKDVEARLRSNGAYYRAPDEDRAGQKLSDMCLLIFTSGTTGLPKPAVVPWRKFLVSGRTVSMWLGMKSTDRFYTAMPLYHSSATVLGLSLVLHVGATFIVSDHFSPRTFFASATASKATIMQYIGEMCRYLTTTPATPFDRAHNIRIAFGNGLRPDVWQSFKSRYNITEICEFYSATEAVGGTFVKSKNDFGAGAVGRSGALLRTLYGAREAIVKHDVETGEPWRDPETGLCARVQAGEAGEALSWLDPANMEDRYVGYFDNAKASNSKVLRDVFKKGDAWYRSGDLLIRDPQGRLFFIDRIGDTYRWKSENVSTNEVSELFGSHALISEINVYGVELPGHDGRAGCAALILKGNSSQKNNNNNNNNNNNDDKESEEEKKIMRSLSEHARRKLPKYAVPLFLRLVDKFEVTGTSKYTKHGLRTQGVDPEKVGVDKVFWLPPGAETYVPFRREDWQHMKAGRVKL